jgi:hypothetical protein
VNTPMACVSLRRSSRAAKSSDGAAGGFSAAATGALSGGAARSAGGAEGFAGFLAGSCVVFAELGPAADAWGGAEPVAEGAFAAAPEACGGTAPVARAADGGGTCGDGAEAAVGDVATDGAEPVAAPGPCATVSGAPLGAGLEGVGLNGVQPATAMHTRHAPIVIRRVSRPRPSSGMLERRLCACNLPTALRLDCIGRVYRVCSPHASAECRHI